MTPRPATAFAPAADEAAAREHARADAQDFDNLPEHAKDFYRKLAAEDAYLDGGESAEAIDSEPLPESRVITWGVTLDSLDGRYYAAQYRADEATGMLIGPFNGARDAARVARREAGREGTEPAESVGLAEAVGSWHDDLPATFWHVDGAPGEWYAVQRDRATGERLGRSGPHFYCETAEAAVASMTRLAREAGA